MNGDDKTRLKTSKGIGDEELEMRLVEIRLSLAFLGICILQNQV